MDPLGSPPGMSMDASPRMSVTNASATTSAVASPARGKSHRSVKFDPTIAGGEAAGQMHSNELSLDTSFIHEVGADGEGRGGRDDAAYTSSPLLGGHGHEREYLPPFQLTRDDVVAAFEFLDVNGSGLLTMSNLKHRLSAFYPQLTSKEYKFLVEDPSGSGGASATKTSSAAVHGSSAADGGHGQSPSPVVSPSPPANLSFGGGPSPIDGGFGGGDAGLAGAGGLRAAGTRAGLDVDQLWELINSFQQLQRTLGATQGSAGDAPPTQQSRATSTAAFTASLDSYLVGSHGHANARGGDGGVGFDAVGEAFRIYDPRHSRYVEEDVLSRIMARVGFGELSEEELAVLVSTADFDGDGRISLDDFRRLVNMKGRFKK